VSAPAEWREGVRLRHLLGESETQALGYLVRAEKAEAEVERLRGVVAGLREIYEALRTTTNAATTAALLVDRTASAPREEP